MQDMVVDVEANLKMREKQRKAEQEEKLHSLLQKSEEMMQKITLKVESLEHQNTSVVQEESSDIHEQTCHKSDDIFIKPYVKEQSPDILCEYDNFSSFSYLPKYDLYDDECAPQIQISHAEESEPILAESNLQDPLPQSSDLLARFNEEEKEENAENFDFSEGTLPFCFESFEFIRDNYHAVCNKVLSSFDIDHLEESQTLAPDALPLDLQPQSAIECQIEEEDLEAAADDQMIQVDPLPICFQSSELFEEKEEQLVQINQGPSGPVCNELQVSFQVWYDPSAGRLDDGINQCSSPLAGCKAHYQDAVGFQIQRHDSNPEPLYSSLIQLSNCIYMLQDPLVQFFVPAKEIKIVLVFAKISKATSDCMIFVSSISKHKQRSPLMFLLLKWLHWLFHFT